jgi:hypothetical protein
MNCSLYHVEYAACEGTTGSRNRARWFEHWLGKLHIEGVDLLGADVTHDKRENHQGRRRTKWRNASNSGQSIPSSL